MEALTRSQKGRIAIRNFMVIADALALRGFYRPNGRSGQTLEQALRTLSPEIYGSMNDPRRIELNGLEYVLDRLPRGIESCNRIVLTAQEEFVNTPFEPIQPLKRRRLSYAVGETEICFVITRGLSEVYDILTHITFLNIEARKVYDRMTDDKGNLTSEWKELEAHLIEGREPDEKVLDQAIWDLSILLGRTFQETRDTYHSLEKHRKENGTNNGLFRIVYGLGRRMAEETADPDQVLVINFTPSLQALIGHHTYSENWARSIRRQLSDLELMERPLHIISANLHSVVNTLYAYPALGGDLSDESDVYEFFSDIKERGEEIKTFAAEHGFIEISDSSGNQIDCQVIDTARTVDLPSHPGLRIDKEKIRKERPVILVMDYAFGIQAFEAMDELLDMLCMKTNSRTLTVESISVMGKAGTLPGQKGDIMLATSFVIEGTTDNYIFKNDLKREDFPDADNVFVGPMLTVVGTSLQNRDVLERFQNSSWRAVGLEMEGGHYQRAISAAIIREHIPSDVRVRYAYYASDNPLISGETLASGSLGEEGIRPTYMITKVILEKILN